MPTPYHILAHTKADLREAKDHEQTVRAICESVATLTGKNETDRRRELTLALSQDGAYRSALAQLREAEYAVDRAQADVEAAESERRDREWGIRARLAEALERLPKTPDNDIDWHDLHFQTEQRKFEAIERNLRQPGNLAQAQREMDELFST